MTGWIGIAVGLFLLAMVFSDRSNMRQAWRSPARWWKPGEVTESSRPAQPLNVILGLVLSIAALAYGIVTLIH